MAVGYSMEWFYYGLLSAAFFSFYYVILKRNLHHKHVIDYLFVYTAFLFLAALPLYRRVTFDLSFVTYALLVADALMLLLFFVTLTLAYKHLETSEIAPLSNITTLLVVVAGVLFFKEVLTDENILGILLVVFGAFILEVGIKLDRIRTLLVHLRNKYIKLVLLSSLFASVSVIIDKVLLDPSLAGLSHSPVNVFTLHFFTRTFIFFSLSCFTLARKKYMVGIRHGLRQSGIMICIASIAYTLGNLLYYKALSLSTVSLVMPVLAISSLMTTIVGGELFHEHKLRQKIIASIIMIIGVYYIVR